MFRFFILNLKFDLVDKEPSSADEPAEQEPEANHEQVEQKPDKESEHTHIRCPTEYKESSQYDGTAY